MLNFIIKLLKNLIQKLDCYLINLKKKIDKSLVRFQKDLKQILLDVLLKVSNVVAETLSCCIVLLIDKLLQVIVCYLLKAVFVFLAFTMLFLLLLIVFLVIVICLFLVFAVLFMQLLEMKSFSNLLFEIMPGMLFKHMLLIPAAVSSVVLTLSAASLTVSYQAFLAGSKKKTLLYLALTIVLAIVFIVFQIIGSFFYINYLYIIKDNVYGFYLYVTVCFSIFLGILGLIIFFVKILFNSFPNNKLFIEFKAIIWYWHCVDVVWLFLFLYMCWWGNLT